MQAESSMFGKGDHLLHAQQWRLACSYWEPPGGQSVGQTSFLNRVLQAPSIVTFDS
jgi:hypothetical protein